MNNLEGEVCVVTGAASGIGQQMAVALANKGAVVVANARNEARSQEAVTEIKRLSGSDTVEALPCDLTSVDGIRAAAADCAQRFPKIRLLVNNAAVFNKTRRTTATGLELGFAVNNLAPFLLTNLLLDPLKAGAPSRVVMMSMPSKTPIDFDDPQMEKSFNGLKNLEMTKGCEQLLTIELARRLEGTGVSAVAVSPGLTQSKLPAEAPLPLRLIFKLFGKSPEKGAVVPLSACLDDKFQSGQFVGDKGKVETYPAFINPENADRLWKLNSSLAGLN